LQEERKIKKEEFLAAIESKKNEKRNRTRKEKKEAKVRVNFNLIKKHFFIYVLFLIVFCERMG
jgi:hypothetical protein